MNSLTKRFIQLLIVKNIIKDKDKNIYVYGFNQLLFTGLNLITVIILGVIFNKLMDSIIFMCTYIPIRVYAGGYHAKTHLKCYIFSIIMLSIILFILKINLISLHISLILVLISSILILFLSPVEDKNKPLDKLEKKVYKKRTIRNFIIALIVLLIFLLLNKSSIIISMSLAFTCNGIMLILGKLNNITQKS